MKPLQVFLIRASEAFVQALVADPAMAEVAFLLRCDRIFSDMLASTIGTLHRHGPNSWLYYATPKGY